MLVLGDACTYDWWAIYRGDEHTIQSKNLKRRSVCFFDIDMETKTGKFK
jgi:hypothetical protein